LRTQIFQVLASAGQGKILSPRLGPPETLAKWQLFRGEGCFFAFFRRLSDDIGQNFSDYFGGRDFPASQPVAPAKACG
jgi:hypothetical protein